MHSDKVPVIFGLKLRQVREAYGEGLKQFSRRVGLSPSYLNEIEKGKKYPKVDKILRIAEALGVSYDELVSLKLGSGLDPIEALLESPLVEALPLRMLGLTPRDVMDLLTRAPQEASAFLRTLAEIAASYNMNVEHIFYAMLRSYQQTHDNYFAEIERAAAAFAAGHGWARYEALATQTLRETVLEELGVAVDEATLGNYPELGGLRSVWVDGEPPRLLINPRLAERQKAFELGREIGYRDLELQARGASSSRTTVTSFEQVLNDFKASYYAGALLIDERALVSDLRAVFARRHWDEAAFLDVLRRYDVTPEMFMYRLAQAVPRWFGLRQCHLVRLMRPAERESVRMIKQFNLSGLLIPPGIDPDEHYCRRWVSVGSLHEMARQQAEGGAGPAIAVQRSHFVNRDIEYFLFSLARPLLLTPGTLSSVTLSFQLTPEFKRTVAFWDDPAVRRVDVHETCERCPMPDCGQRVADPVLLERQRALEQRDRSLAHLVGGGRG